MTNLCCQDQGVYIWLNVPDMVDVYKYLSVLYLTWLRVNFVCLTLLQFNLLQFKAWPTDISEIKLDASVLIVNKITNITEVYLILPIHRMSVCTYLCYK